MCDAERAVLAERLLGPAVALPPVGAGELRSPGTRHGRQDLATLNRRQEQRRP